MGICLTTIHESITILTLQIGCIYSLKAKIIGNSIFLLSHRMLIYPQQPEAQKEGREQGM